MTRLLLACAIAAVCSMAQAQTSKPKSPGEMAAASRAMAQKQGECSRQANEQKLKLSARRKFIKQCVKG
jgi:hypothetical protein